LQNCNAIKLFALLLFYGMSATGQQLSFDYYNKSNGLVNNEVHCIVRAKNGSMYFGTPSGLSIFDGASFTNYDLHKGFLHNIVSGIYQNGEETFLFTRSNQFYRLINQQLHLDSAGQHIAIKNMYEDSHGRRYACTYSGLYIFNNGKLTALPWSKGNAFTGINCVQQWQDSLLIVGRSFEPLDIYNTHTWKKLASSSVKLFVRSMCSDAAGNCWIATIGAGMMLLKPGSVQDSCLHFESLPAAFAPFQQAEFRALAEDKNKNLWMGSINNGIIRYNPQTGTFAHITTEQGLASNTVFALYCDEEDNTWIGTNRGLQKLPPHYMTSYSSKQGLPADLVLDAWPLPGNNIITTGYYGVGYLTQPAEKIKSWQPPLEDEYFSSFTSFNNRYFALSLRKLAELAIEPASVSAKHLYPLPEHFRSMTLFDKDKLLLGGDSSILLLYKGKLTTLSKDSVHHISCMMTDSMGILWTGDMNNNINAYPLHQNHTTVTASPLYHYPAATLGPQDILQCVVNGLGKKVLFGSSQSGIIAVVPVKNKLLQAFVINTSSGLSSNNVLCFAWHNDSTLLAGTGNGLDKIIFSSQGSTFTVHNINEYYNFSNTVYSVRENESGVVFLGTESGLLQLPSVDIEKSLSQKLPIAISAIQLLENPDSFIAVRETIELPYKNNGISIFYASPSLTNEKSIRYTYLLTGSNQNKSSRPSSSNHVTFLNLAPGEYRFMVKAVNVYGAVSLRAATVLIVIKPPFWQKWWFILLLAAAVAAVIFLLVRRRIHNIRRESLLKNKIAETEMMALRAQMNPHFIFNCMNIIDGLITGNRREEAQDFLQKFSKLIRLVLENSQYQQVPLQQDLQALQLYTELEAIRSNHHFTYTFLVDEQLLEYDCKIPPLLLQPYIENAIVHGLRNKENGEGHLLVSLKKEGDKIVASIEDNGVGRKKANQLNEENRKPHQQMGMKVTGKRISLLKQMNQNKVQIQISDAGTAVETGTRVVITLPMHLKFE